MPNGGCGPRYAIAAFMDAATRDEITLQTEGLSYTLKKRLASLSERLGADPSDPGAFEQFETAVRLARSLPFEVDLWAAQNLCYRVLQEVCEGKSGATTGQEWLQRWLTLADKLNLKCAPAAANMAPPSPEPVPQAA